MNNNSLENAPEHIKLAVDLIQMLEESRSPLKWQFLRLKLYC